MFILTFIIMRAFAEALRLLVLHLSLLFFLRLSWLFRDSELIADIESLKSLSPSSVYIEKNNNSNEFILRHYITPLLN